MTTQPLFWLTICTIFTAIHGATMDIECGQSTVGTIKGDENMAFRITIDQRQNVVLKESNGTFISTLIVMDAKGHSIANVNASDCGEDGCIGNEFLMQTVSPGTYTVKMMPHGKGGMFRVEMICSTTAVEGKHITQKKPSGIKSTGTFLTQFIYCSKNHDLCRFCTGISMLSFPSIMFSKNRTKYDHL